MQRYTSFQEYTFSSGIEFFPALRYQNLQAVRAPGLLLARNQWRSLSYSLTPKKIENTGEGNMEFVAQTYIHYNTICCKQLQTRYLFAAQCTHQLLFSEAQQQQPHNIAELKVNRSANFRDLCSALNCISCMLCFKAHFSVIIFYCFMF